MQETYDLRRDVDKLFNTFSSSKEYKVIANAPAIIHSEGAYKPSTILFSSYQSSHDGTDYFDGILEIKYSNDGITYTRDGSTVTGHTISRTIASDNVNYVKCILYDGESNKLDEQTVPVIRSDSAINLIIANESQVIPCNSDGSLKEVFTFNVPIYCYKGTQYYPATYDSSSSVYDSAFTVLSVTNPTSSNEGNVQIRVDSAPSTTEGFAVIGFIVDGVSITKSVSWAKIKDGAKGNDGADGVDGKDGNGEHYIYCITKDKTPIPQEPVTQQDIDDIIDGSDAEKGGGDSEKTYWYEDPLEVTSDYKYCWVSVRKWSKLTESWGAFSTPSLFNYYTTDGKKGDQGDPGDKGRDGTELTGAEILEKLADQKIDAESVGGLKPSDILTNTIAYGEGDDYQQHGWWKAQKQGNMVMVTLANYRYQVVTPSSYITMFTLPAWAIPLMSVYTTSIPVSIDHRIVIDDSGQVRFRNDNLSAGDVVSLTFTVMYHAKENVGYSTSIVFDDESNNSINIRSSSPLTCTFKYTKDNTLYTFDEGLAVQFIVNGVAYGRTTDSNGKASIKLNFPIQSNLAVTAQFVGNSELLGVQQTKAVTISQALNTTVTMNNNKTATVIGSGNTMGGIKVKVKINDISEYDLMTDYDGVVNFEDLVNARSGTVKVQVTTNDSRCIQATNTQNYTSTNTSETIVVSATPSVVNEGTGTRGWTTANAGALANVNDGSYAKAYNITAQTNFKYLDMLCGYQIPHTATITKAKITIRYASLLGQTSLSKGSFSAPTLDLTNGNNARIVATQQVGSAMQRNDCGNWYTQTWEYNVSSSDGTNSDGRWNTTGIRLRSLTNGGGGYNNNASFGVDYLNVELTYTT